ncbi:MAG: MATE family efflux transporter [Anaerovoracaceae bacterium]|jgi:putative MATE family efflux protein|nr:MATE family efflux transporter [Clostridiales bacterium]
MSQNLPPANQNETTSSRKNRMGTDPILPLIMKMSLPAMFSMFIQAFYNIVDSIYVSRLGESALSAVSLIYPIQLLSIAIGVGTGVGLASLISRRLGEGRQKEADLTAAHGIFLALCSWIVFALFGLFFSEVFVRAFSDDPLLIVPAASYCRIICTGSLFIFTAINAERIMQATGNMILPMLCALSGAITNIILDPILIFGLLGMPAMGVTGAAIATVIGRFVAMVLSMTLLYTKPFSVKIHLRNFRPVARIIKDVYIVGLPSIIMQSVGSILTLGLNALLIQFSATAVAVLGVYYKVQTFVFLPVFGLNQGLLPVLGYNYGAKNRGRLKKTFFVGIVTALTIMLFGTFVFQTFPREVMGLFRAEGELMRMGVDALRIISLCYPFAAVGILMSTFFQATGHGIYALISSILRQLILLLPLAYILAYTLGLDTVWWSYVIADVAATCVSLYLLRRLWKKEIQTL